jgi:xanthosine utilization system XapX-like protein
VGDPESAARGALRRSTVIYLLLFLAAAVVVYYIATNRESNLAFVSLSIVGIVGLLLGYYVYQHLRDLMSSLTESEGVILRKWSRADIPFLLQGYYIAVNRTVFRVQAEDYLHLREEMYVKIVHFPHTLNVVSVHEVRGPGDAEPALPAQQ